MASLIQALAVAEYLNFHHAAKALGTSQSSVSTRIKALEEELGIALFERNTRGVRLTKEGRHFVQQIEAGVDQLDHAVMTANMTALGERGHLLIGVHGLIAGSFLDNLLARYRKEYPEIAIDMMEGAARDTIMSLRAGQIDIAFLVGNFDLPDCRSRPIWTEQLIVALPVDHPLSDKPGVTWDELASEQFLVRHGGTGPQVRDHIILRLAARWPPPTIRRVEVERGTLISMVAQGFGITLLGEASLCSPTMGVVFRPITDEPDPIVFSAVWSPHNRSVALQNLFDLAAEMRRTSLRNGMPIN